MKNTPNYIKTLVKPNGKSSGRKVWSVDLETVWLPFFTATNSMGDTAIPCDALGAPLRLTYNQDGSVKFSKAGRPVIRVAKDISDNVKLVRENFVANLQNYANTVISENTDAYKKQVKLCQEAGKPILENDRLNLEEALELRKEAEAEALRQAPEAKKEPAGSQTEGWELEPKAESESADKELVNA